MSGSRKKILPSHKLPSDFRPRRKEHESIIQTSNDAARAEQITKFIERVVRQVRTESEDLAFKLRHGQLPQ